MFVVGPRDAEQGTVSVRDRIDGDLGAMPFEAALEKLKVEVASKQVRQVAQNARQASANGAERTSISRYARCCLRSDCMSDKIGFARSWESNSPPCGNGCGWLSCN